MHGCTWSEGGGGGGGYLQQLGFYFVELIRGIPILVKLPVVRMKWPGGGIEKDAHAEHLARASAAVQGAQDLGEDPGTLISPKPPALNPKS